jgi:hypothetical protein
MLILKVDPATGARTTWALADAFGANGTAIAAGPGGAVYIGGSAMGDFDMDPGPTVARRWLGSGTLSGFVVKLAADGTYQWSRVLNATMVNGMASAADGGVVAIAASGQQGMVTRLTASGDAVWTFPVGDGVPSLTSIAISGTSLAVAGFSFGTEDFDPSPGVDLLFGDIAYVSRFTF